MHGLILAGGEGTRLAAGGIALPKPLVEVAGRPQLLRLLETLDALGCESLTCAIRADLPAVAALLDARRFRAPFRVMPCRTPSSLHTLAEALPGVSPGPVFCSMVDTVMRWRDWGEVYRQTEARLAEGADARSEEHTSELQSRLHLVCRLLLEKKKKILVALALGGRTELADLGASV